MSIVLFGNEKIRPNHFGEGIIRERLIKANGVSLFQFNAINAETSSILHDQFPTAIVCKVNPVFKRTLREWIQSTSKSERAYLEITWTPYSDRRVFLNVASIVDRLCIPEETLRRAYATKTAEAFFSYLENMEKNTREVSSGLAWIPRNFKNLQWHIDQTKGLLRKANFVNERMSIGSTMILDGDTGFIHKAEDGKMQISMILSQEKSVYKIYAFACRKCFLLEKKETLKEVEQRVIASIIEQNTRRGSTSFPGLPKFLKVISSVVKEDLSSLDMKLVLSEPWRFSAANVISCRQSGLFVSTRILLKEGLSALSGLDTLINKLSFIHLNITIENTLYVQDRELLIGDTSRLVDVSSAEKWLKSYENFDCESSYNFSNDIFTIRQFCEWGILLSQGNLAAIEDVSAHAQRELSREECIEFVFKAYRQSAEKVAVFQLGVLFYQLLFQGELPYSLEENSKHMKMEESNEGGIIGILRDRIGVPKMAETIAGMLATNLRSRPTVAEAISYLKPFLQD